jgi:sialate O-acetylesterase
MCKKLMVLSFMLYLASVALADVTVPTMFSDHAVLQRNMAVPVWGTSSGNEQVTVDFAGQSKTTTSSAAGEWMIYLDPMAASTSPSDMVITGNNVITLTGVQVGEVWVGSGQSNMSVDVAWDCDATAAIADAGNYNIRFFNVNAAGGNVGSTVWQVSNSSTAPDISAVLFYFGRHLAQEMSNVPIGLVSSSVAGTAIEKWATCAGSGSLYTGRVQPITPYGIKGAIWYQGEWDSRSAGDAEKYYWQMPCLIDEWRTDWQIPNFPFYIVQLPKMNLKSIHIVRDATLQTALDDPKVEMSVHIDNPGSDVHPICKTEFARRLAILALEYEYGQGTDSRSPFYNEAASYVAGDTIGVVFDDVAGGLASSGGPLAEWEIADSGGSYVAADAVIVGAGTVEVSSPSVSVPVSARYAYRPNCVDNNLINSAGLPASPIREVTPGSGGPVCGDANCDPGEDQCNCPDDCGTPPLTEISCTDGIDEDCDEVTDCDDTDCIGDPACPSFGDATCDPGEDECNCSADCGMPPATETNCSDGIDDDCDNDTDCDDTDCDGDPACPDCVPKNGACSDNADCCSGNCRPSGKCA